MSIQNIAGTTASLQSRPAAARARVTGTSFQEQLAQAAAVPRASSGRARLTKDELLSALHDTKCTMLEKMKLGREKKEEEEAWNEMMDYLDAWIESLREEAGVEKTARAYADFMSRRTGRAAGAHEKDLGDFILEQLADRLANR